MRRLDLECAGGDEPVVRESDDAHPEERPEPHPREGGDKRSESPKRKYLDPREERKEKVAAFASAISEHAGVPVEALGREFGLTDAEVSSVLAESVEDFPWLKDPANPNNIYVATRRDVLTFLHRLNAIGGDPDHPMEQRAKEVLANRGQRLERELTQVLASGSSLVRPVMNRIEDLQVIRPRVAMVFAKEAIRNGHPAAETLLAHYREVGAGGDYLDLLELSGRQVQSQANELGLVLRSRILVIGDAMDPVLRGDIHLLWEAQDIPGEDASWASHHVYDLGTLQRESWGMGKPIGAAVMPFSKTEFLEIQASDHLEDLFVLESEGGVRPFGASFCRPRREEMDWAVFRSLARLEGEHLGESARRELGEALANISGRHGGVWLYFLREAEGGLGTLPKGVVLHGLAKGLRAWEREPDLAERAVRVMAYSAVREPAIERHDVSEAYQVGGIRSYHPELSRVLRGFYRFGGGPDSPQSRALAVAALRGIEKAGPAGDRRGSQGPWTRIQQDLQDVRREMGRAGSSI